MDSITRLPVSKGFWVVFALAAALYAASAYHQPFGLLDDDARHMLAAESLLQGRYVDLSRPGDPPLDTLLPGYPLLLLPAAAVHSIALAKAINVLFLLGALFLAWGFFEKAEGSVWLLALLAFNPLSPQQAGTVMTEAAYLFFTLLALRLSARALENGLSAGQAVALAALCAGCAWIRPHGALVIFACGAAFLERPGLRRSGLLFLLTAAALTSLPYLRNWLVARTPAIYFEHIPVQGSLRTVLSATLELAAGNLLALPKWAFSQGVAGWSFPVPFADSPASSLLGAAIGLTALRGLWLESRRESVRRPAVFYCTAYLFLHLLWVNRFPRYMFPLLPFLYLAISQGLPWRRRLAPAALAAVLAVFAYADARIALGQYKVMEGAVPTQTLEWIEANAPKEGALAALSRTQMFRWYTGKKCLELLPGQDPDEWFHRLSSSGVTHTIVHPSGDLENYAASRRDSYKEAVARLERNMAYPGRFRFAFQAPEETFQVYELLQVPGFESGWVLMQQARDALDQGDLPRAYALLERARDQRAPLVRLPFYLGTTAMLLGRRDEAISALEEALRREPDLSPAARNLDRARSLPR